MKLYVVFAAAAAATAMIGAAMAADSDQFLIRGDATKGMLEQNMLNVATAEKIAQACVAERRPADRDQRQSIRRRHRRRRFGAARSGVER